MGAAKDYNEYPWLIMGDAQVRGVHDENRMDEDNGAEGENMRATFINSLEGK